MACVWLHALWALVLVKRLRMMKQVFLCQDVRAELHVQTAIAQLHLASIMDEIAKLQKDVPVLEQEIPTPHFVDARSNKLKSNFF